MDLTSTIAQVCAPSPRPLVAVPAVAAVAAAQSSPAALVGLFVQPVPSPHHLVLRADALSGRYARLAPGTVSVSVDKASGHVAVLPSRESPPDGVTVPAGDHLVVSSHTKSAAPAAETCDATTQLPHCGQHRRSVPVDAAALRLLADGLRAVGMGLAAIAPLPYSGRMPASLLIRVCEWALAIAPAVPGHMSAALRTACPATRGRVSLRTAALTVCFADTTNGSAASLSLPACCTAGPLVDGHAVGAYACDAPGLLPDPSLLDPAWSAGGLRRPVGDMGPPVVPRADASRLPTRIHLPLAPLARSAARRLDVSLTSVFAAATGERPGWSHPAQPRPATRMANASSQVAAPAPTAAGTAVAVASSGAVAKAAVDADPLAVPTLLPCPVDPRSAWSVGPACELCTWRAVMDPGGADDRDGETTTAASRRIYLAGFLPCDPSAAGP